MVKDEDIIKLYSTVFEEEKKRFQVTSNQIRNGITEIGKAYAPDPFWEWKENCPSDYYEDACNRCAYLHKYAMIHMAVFCDVLHQALKSHSVKEVMEADFLNLFSLGSGPGTDIVASLLALNEIFGLKQINATLIDCCNGWESVFKATVSALRSTDFIHINDMVSEENFYYEHVVQDLLDIDVLSQSHGIRGADVIMMVKFVSAAACKTTRRMVENIFRAMKPGALLFFVDNAAGGFWELMSESAKKCGMKSVFGPLKHYEFKRQAFRRSYHGRESQYEAKVTAEIWKKEELSPWNTTHILQDQFFRYREEEFPALDTVDSGGPVIAGPQMAHWPYGRKFDSGHAHLESGIVPVRLESGIVPVRLESGIVRVRLESVCQTAEAGVEKEANEKCCTIM